MLDCTELITHISKAYDPVIRQDKLVKKEIEGCGWFREEKVTVSEKVVHVADLIKVRIPLYGRTDIPNIREGDILIHGSADITNMTIGKIRSIYEDSMEVTSVTYNTHSAPYSRHIRCSGS